MLSDDQTTSSHMTIMTATTSDSAADNVHLTILIFSHDLRILVKTKQFVPTRAL